MEYSFSDNPALSERLFDLLDTVFPGVRQVAQNARALGAPWESVSTPFIHFEQGRAIAHVGVIELSLVLLGRTVTVGSIHGVATHPEARRRGHFRRLMEEVLQYCAGRYETLMLTTEHPEYFAPFGFRVVKEHLFTVKCDSAGGSDGFRLLDTSQTGDIALLHRLLETRQAVSQVVGAVNEKAVFCFNEGSRPLHYAADLDVTACLELEEGRLKLFDIVGPKIPPLARVLERIPQRLDEAAICFSADQLAVEAEATPYVLDHDGPSYLMVHGPFAAEGQPFTLPRSART
jgi:predicted N-acetyltransferase YhbS